MHDQLLKCLSRAIGGRPRKGEAVQRLRYAANGRVDATGVALAVDTVGTLPRPLEPKTAVALSVAATPARFGRREKTLLDATVRSSGEIAAERLQLDWPVASRAALLAKVAEQLGVDAIDCRLHNLLLYGPGQFFKPHQDTEKHERMIGTLVLIWPSAHVGGALVIRHGDSALRFESQQLGRTSDLLWCAFYADCRHEIEVVTEGWRLALTFDLVLPADANLPRPQANRALLDALRTQFPPGRHEPFVFLFDHEYSEHGLSWSLLKGNDRLSAQALRACAESLGLTARLALARHHETCMAEFERGDEPRRGEVIDSDLTLNFFPDAPPSDDDLYVPWHQVASFTQSGPAHVVDEQYEGYMGNYGETLDYWYRRAALVIQSELGELRTQFQTDFKRSLKRLLSRSAQTDRDHIQRVTSAVVDLIESAVRRHGSRVWAPVATLATKVDAALARQIVAHFDQSRFEPADASRLAQLEGAHGTKWMVEVLRDWSTRRSRSYRGESADYADDADIEPDLWPRKIDGVVDAAQRAGLSAQVIDAWLDMHIEALIQDDRRREKASAASRLAEEPGLRTAVAALARALARRRHRSGSDRLVTHLIASRDCHPPEELASVALALSDGNDAASRLRAHVVAALERRLATPPRDSDNHAIDEVQWHCRCADCAKAIAWAESSSRTPLLMPISEARRQHVVDSLRLSAAPLKSRTIKQGSPYKLELSKPGDLLQREQARRRQWEIALKSLQRPA